MHRDEHNTAAARVDRDAQRVMELGAAAGAVEEAFGAAAGERGGHPGGDLDTADTVVIFVLRCIMGENTLKKRAKPKVWPVRSLVRHVRGGCAVCGMAGCGGYEGGRRTATSAKVPLGSIATPRG